MRRFVRFAFAPLLLVTVLVACDDDDDDLTGTQPEVFTASLSGDAEVPPVTTTATGTASFTRSGDEVQFTLDVSDIQNTTAAHIHIGVAGVNGPIAVFLFDADAGSEFSGSGRLSSGTFTGADIEAGVEVDFTELLELMRNDGAYVNVHTSQNPGGEIRGQIELD